MQKKKDSNTNKNKKKVLAIIKNIKEINEFCEKEEIFKILFTNDFWKLILYYYKDPTQNNIRICYEIRIAFISYYN